MNKILIVYLVGLLVHAALAVRVFRVHREPFNVENGARTFATLVLWPLAVLLNLLIGYRETMW